MFTIGILPVAALLLSLLDIFCSLGMLACMHAKARVDQIRFEPLVENLRILLEDRAPPCLRISLTVLSFLTWSCIRQARQSRICLSALKPLIFLPGFIDDRYCLSGVS